MMVAEGSLTFSAFLLEQILTHLEGSKAPLDFFITFLLLYFVQNQHGLLTNKFKMTFRDRLLGI